MRYLKFILTAALFLMGCTLSVQAKRVKKNDHAYVDLGLPSGTLWATCNVGASKPEEYGDYFAWGETKPKKKYTLSNCIYVTIKEEGGFNYVTKYNMSGYYGGTIDSLLVLLPEDDVATANWGNGWRMPTKDEIVELKKNTYAVWSDGYNGTDVRGVIFYKAKSADDKGEFVGSWPPPPYYSVASDSHVFLPAAGYRWADELNAVAKSGYYWSSSLHEDYEEIAHILYFHDREVALGDDGRYMGFPVRAVRAK